MNTKTTPAQAADALILQVPAQCLLTRARQVSRVVTALYDQALRPYGVLSPQFSLLVMIALRSPISRSELGRENHQDRSTLTRNLQPLIGAGWVSEAASPDGGRARPVSITPQGRALLRRAAPAWAAAQQEARALLGDDGAQALVAIADALPSRSP